MLKTIYSQRAWINNQLREATLYIRDGRIASIRHGRPDTDDFIDCGTDVLMPGVIDAHVHINEPGRTDWEGFETATRAAAAGGTTTLVDMPLNSSPVTVSKLALEQKMAAASGKLQVNCG